MMVIHRMRRSPAMLLLAVALLGGVSTVSAQATHGEDDGRDSTPAALSPAKNKQEKNEDEAYRHSGAVKAFGKLLGMDVDQAASVFEIANFVVLAGLVGWFLAKNLPQTFRDRTGIIQKNLVAARAATEEAKARMSGVEARLGKLDAEIAAMRAQAERDAAADEARIKAAAEDEKNKILAAAEQEISAASLQARRDLRKYAAELAIEQAARKLVVHAETDRLLVRDFAQRLVSDDPAGSKGGQN